MATMRTFFGVCLQLCAVMELTTAACTGTNTSLGCFTMGPPWSTSRRPVPPPQTPEVIDTHFTIFNRGQPAGIKVVKTPISLSGSTYNGTKPTFFIIHGFNANRTWVLLLKDTLLTEFDGNVIVVGWSQAANATENYFQAVSNTRIVAEELRILASYLVSDKNSAKSRMHFIGHSLGAHIAGYVGKAMPGIARITALDAAQPAFEGFPAQVRLDVLDAVFVEAIHTNARPFIPYFGLGYMAPIGHADFYVNGGGMQPGCVTPLPPASIVTLQVLTNMTAEVFMRVSVCPHQRAYQLFISSIVNKNNTMWGHKVLVPLQYLSALSNKCTKDTCSPLGLQTSNYPARGVFVVKTTDASPFYIKEAESDTTMDPFKLLPTVAL